MKRSLVLVEEALTGRPAPETGRVVAARCDAVARAF